MKLGSASEVRAAIARLLLGDVSDEHMGDITLHPHQRQGVGRILELLEQHGGALLADDVGLGKTFIALAIARRASRPIVIAPAAVRENWRASARTARVAIRFQSVETLARRGATLDEADLVIIDEAHHLRNARTQRFAAASALCRGTKVLLLSATPVQNRLGDLRTVLSLFLGERARALSLEEMSCFVVRRVERDLDPAQRLGLPRVETPEWLPPVSDLDCLDRLLALPAAVPPADGDDGGMLLTYTLVRQWASSRAALRCALRRRLARGLAMEDALLAGRVPSRAELAAWCFAEGAQQLSFPELIVRAESADASRLLDQVRRHAGSVRDLLAWLQASIDPDAARVAILRALLNRRSSERVVAFSEYADTVEAFYRGLAPDLRVAMLSRAGGRVAGGPVSRRELLDRFAPGASARARSADRIDLLLTTDVLSEGVNLQDASVVVHLDLTWNPARLQQRVGRLRRLGAARESVGVFMMPPPAPAERMLHLEHRLRVKLALAGRSVGVAGAILPGMAVTARGDASWPTRERILAAVSAWSSGTAGIGHPLAAGVRSARSGALACVRREGAVSLVAITEAHLTDDRQVVEDFVLAADGEHVAVRGDVVIAIQLRLERWLRQRTLSDVVDLPSMHVAHSRRTMLHRVDAIARRAPRHAQPQLAPLMRAARTAATATLSAGAERVLDELSRAAMADEAWLHAVSEFATLHARPHTAKPPEVLALLILCDA